MHYAGVFPMKTSLRCHSVAISLFIVGMAKGQAEDGSSAPESLPISKEPASYKTMSLEELMNIEVTSVSKQPERLSAAASAIQVVQGDAIRRSGATSLPEALRLAPNLQVARVNASQWAISARGFNNVLANKLLVMIDGRTVYTPLYAGVFWDAQNTLMEDIDRIEVISGPGGTMWGANAVNGVINVISKSAKDTQGTYASGSAGTFMKDSAAIRSGGQLGEDLYMRVYGQRFHQDDTVLTDGSDAHDDWGMTQGGFRMDWEPGGDVLTLQGDAYDGDPNPEGVTPVTIRGGNVLGRWKHTISDSSDFYIQSYVDWTSRDFNNGFTQEVRTYDVDWQHRFPLGNQHEVIWGLGYRLMDDREENLPLLRFLPAHKYLHLYTGFIQDNMVLVTDRLHFTIGSKFEHNDYTGFEYQPSGRLTWMPTEYNTIWAAISRAVRTPSRIDTDFSLLLTPSFPVVQTSDDFKSETLLAYELGWRSLPYDNFSCSMALFYNQYDHVRTAEPGPPPFGLPITFGNGVEGNTYGMELCAENVVTDWWRLRGGYTWLKKDLSVKSGSNDLNDGTAESNDPEEQFLLQSSLDLPGNVEWDIIVRTVDMLPDPFVPSYVELDMRIGVRPTNHLELSIVGQNLLDDRHPEFIPSSPSPREIERSVYGTMIVRW